MTISEALKNGKNHITCVNGVEFDVRLVRDGGYVIHHIEKNGRPASKNRTKISAKDADAWVKKKHGGIREVSEGKYEKFIPEPGGMEAFENQRRNPQDDMGGYSFDDEQSTIQLVSDFTRPRDEQMPEMTQITIDEEEDEMPDLSRPGYAQQQPEEEYEPEYTEPQYSYAQDPYQGQDIMRQQENIYTQNVQQQVQPQVPRASVILEDMVMRGDIKTQGSVEVLGTLQGNIAADGNVTVTGCMNGNIHANDVYVTGTAGAEVIGNIQGNTIRVDAKCVIIGDIAAENDLVLEGAVYGNLDVQHRLYIKAASIIKGNVSSGSIIIEEGAVLSGMCEQKYADTTSDKFFDAYKLKLNGKPLNPDANKKNKPSMNSYAVSDGAGDVIMDDGLAGMGISQMING